MNHVKAGIPANAKRISLRPVALGEVTGHHHSFMSNTSALVDDLVEMYEADGKTYAMVVGPEGSVSLVHQQHKAQPIAPGAYEVVIQSEFTEWGRQEVLD